VSGRQSALIDAPPTGFVVVDLPLRQRPPYPAPRGRVAACHARHMARAPHKASRHGWTSWRRATALTHLLVSAAMGLLLGAGVALAYDPLAGGLVAWAVAGSFFLGWTWTSIWPLNAHDTSQVARLEDPSRPVRDLVLLLLAAGSLLTVGVVIFRANDAGPVRLVLGVACVVTSWGVLHTIFVLRYTRLYYTEPVGGIDFKQEPDPTYRDFAYVGFTVGMTFQVSDTDIGKASIRTTVLGHALLSFVFGAVILAITINLLAGLSR
jgi:uncharacterized membrane protein